MLPVPIVIINFKTYPHAIGKKAVQLARTCFKVAEQTQKNIAVCPAAMDVRQVFKQVRIPVLTQHMDAKKFGTGKITAEQVTDAGAVGTLLNHSEYRLPKRTLEQSIKRAKKAGLTTVVCVQDVKEAKEVAKLQPDMIAYEPPELIGGKISVSTAHPEVIKKAVRAVGKKSILIVGAGVHSAKDVKIGLQLGAQGFLVASAVTKADNPEKVLLDLVKPLKKGRKHPKIPHYH